jgi:uncharacterized delta-60 repeat protein
MISSGQARFTYRGICALHRVARALMRALAGGIALAIGVLLSAGAFAQQDPVPGSLHTSPLPGFASGNGKIANLAIGTGSDFASAVALQPDGKIVLAGYCFNGSDYDFCVARLNADGSLDATFDGPGGAGNGKFLLPIGSDRDIATAIALQPDGKIVLGGYCRNASNDDFCVARLNADGTLDASFDGPGGAGNGKFLLPIGAGDDQANAIALQPDGKILIAGSCVDGFYYFCLARLNADGTLDTSFDGPGGAGNGKFLFAIGLNDDVANALALQPDGKILVAGYCSNGSNDDFCIARLNTDGTLDASFDGPGGNGNGKFLLPIGSSGDVATAIALQPDGKIVLAGYCSNGFGFDICIARLNADGTLDASFDGPAGAGDGKFVFSIGVSVSYARALALQPDGKIVLAGYCVNASDPDFCIARLNTDGTLDSSFDGPGGNGNGKFLLPIGSSGDVATALALQPDGKIVVAGNCFNGTNDDFCIARLNGGPFGAQNCKLDFDGDGKVLATVDGLIATRVMLGMTGNAVIAGITFAPHATRTTWPAIRDYLVNQCGMVIAP